MAGWISPRTWVAGEVHTAAQHNEIRDDLNAIKPTTASVLTGETTASTTYADLATSGPSVTITTGTTATVIISVQMANNTANNGCATGVAISGATTRAADDVTRLAHKSDSANSYLQGSAVYSFTGLTAGSNTFKLRYKVITGGTGTFENRQITVIGV